MSEAMIGYGSRFQIGDNSSPTLWADVAEVTDITPPSDSVDVVDVTHMQSPNRTREFILGLNDPGEASFTINFIPGGDGDAAIQALRGSGEVVPLRIIYPNDFAWTFEGLLTGYTPTVPTDDKMTAEVTFKVTGSYIAEMFSDGAE